MAYNPFRIELKNLPGEGKDISGTVPASFFKLEPDDTIQAKGPLTFDLHVERDENDLIITGEVDALFELECGRCLQKFAYQAHSTDFLSDQPIEPEDSTIDLTEVIRDDILVALPSYPRCEDGNVEPRACPAEGRFETEADDADGEEPASQPAAVWEVLDQLKKR